jgi:hypothetical protein
MTRTHISEQLKTYDFIIIAENSTLVLGFYLGRGKNNSFQYYHLWTLSNHYNKNYEGKLYKSYFNSYNEYRVAKYHPDCIENPEVKELYDNAIQVIRKLKNN